MIEFKTPAYKLAILLAIQMGFISVGFANDRQTMDNKQNFIIVIGASYAKSWQPEQIAGLAVVNKGIGGQETHEVLERFTKDVIDLNPKPKAVIIWGFINDIFRSPPSELEKEKEEIKANYQAMLKLARENNITPILTTELTITSPHGVTNWAKDLIGSILGKESYQDKINKHVLEINGWIRELANENNIALLDFEQLVIDDDGRRKKKYSTEDGSHISKEAYDLFTQYALKTINNL